MKKMWTRVLLLALVVLALCLTMAACKEKEQPAAEAPEVELYWSVDHKEYNTGHFERMASEDGTVMMILAHEGTQDRYPVKDIFLAKKIDMMVLAGLVFDENGVVVDALHPEACTSGIIAKNAVVTAIEGTTVTANTSGLLDGRDITFEVTDETPVYNVAGTGITVGIPWTVGIDDLVTVLANEDGSVKCVYTEGYVPPMDIYWNVNRMYDSTSKITTRMSDPTGGYSFELAVNGEIKTLRAKESKIAQDIDAMAAKCFGLEFDEEGYITRVIHGGTACGGGSAASWYHCTGLDEQTAEFTRIASGSNMGATYTGTLSKNLQVYDVSGNGRFIGEPTDLRVGDQVHCLLDSRTRIAVVFVVSRKADAPVFWNVDRMWNSKTSKTTRSANANGVYEILVAVGGEQKYVYTTDWEIANKIDGRAAMCFGLLLDENDNIEKFYTPETVTYGTYASWYNITKLDGSDITLYKTSNGDVKNGTLAADCEIYDCSPTAQYEGIKATLQEGDLVHTLKNDKGEISVAFIITRYARWPVYYNLDRKWSDAKAATTRTRNADGYFEFRMAVDGEEVTLKTKSYDVANAIDKEVAKCLTMSVDENGIIYKAMHAKNSTLAKGAARSSYTTVTKVNGYKFTTYKSDTGKYANEKMAWNCKAYNVSSNYLSHQGEETEVQVGDYVHCLSNERGEITFIYIMTRPLNLPVYYNLDRKWDDTNKVSTRTPDGDGVYSFQLAYGGEEVTLYTTDPKVVNDIDKEVAMCVALRIEDGYITYATHAKNSTYCGGGIGMSYATVTEVNGNMVTVRKDGNLTTFEISDDCEMFVTKAGEGLSRGNYTTVREGDFVHCLKDKNGKTNYMAIMSRVKQLPKAEHTCQHVTEDVTWYAWDGTAFPQNGHYVLTEDLELTERVTIDAGVEITLCLNGHKVTNPDRFFTLYGTLNICDHKVDGKYQGTLDSAYSGKVYGALAYIYNSSSNGQLNIYGGNFTHSGEANNGAIIFVGQTTTSGYTASLNLYDGVISGGNSTSKGGAIAVTNGSLFNMYGGEISGNYAKTTAGGVFVADGTFNMYGGTITGNTSGDTGAGVSVDHSKGLFNMFGGEISGNTATGNGGGVNINTGKGVLTGGNVKNNKAAEGGNARVGQSGTLTVNSDAVVSGGSAKNGGNFTVIGKLYVTGATLSGGKATVTGNEISAYSNAAAANAQVYLENATVKGTIRLGAGQGKTELFVKDSTVTDKITVQTNNNNIEVEGKVDLADVNLADGKVITISENGLDDSSVIKVSMANTDKAFVTVTDTNDIAVFKATKTSEKVVVNGNDLYLESSVPAHKHCVCGGLGKVEDHKTCTTTSYAAWDSKTSLPTSGSYYLTEDVTITGPITVSETLNLCLNGHSITSSTRVFSINKGTLNLCDCADTQGVITGNTAGTQANGGVFYVYNNSTFSLYGGTLTAQKKVTGAGGVGCVAGGTNGKMYVYGGTIENGKATKNGGNIIIWDGASMFVYGGEIKNGSSAGGGNVDASKGNLTITGGKFIGGTSSGYGGNIRVGELSTLTVTGGEILGGTAPTGGATIYGNNKDGTGSALIKLLGGKITSGTSNNANNNCLQKFGQSVVVGGDVQIDKIVVTASVKLVESTEVPLTSAASIGVAASSAMTVMESASATAASVIKSGCALAVSYVDGTVKLG